MKEKQLRRKRKRRRRQIHAGQWDRSPADNNNNNNCGKKNRQKQEEAEEKEGNMEEVKGVGGARRRAGEQSGRERPGVAMETGSYQLTSCFPFSTT